MTGAWRYVMINCRRIFRWYPHVGPAERVTHTAIACTRAAALMLPLALPGAVAAPKLGYPGGAAFTGPAYAPFASGGSLLASGQLLGWEALSGLSASSLHHPASLSDDAPVPASVSPWANPASQQTVGVRPELLTDAAPLDVPVSVGGALVLMMLIRVSK